MNTNASVYLTSTTDEMVRAGLSTKRFKRVHPATGSSSCAVDIATEGNNAYLSNWLLGSLEGHLIKAINSKMCDKRGNDFKLRQRFQDASVNAHCPGTKAVTA